MVLLMVLLMAIASLLMVEQMMDRLMDFSMTLKEVSLELTDYYLLLLKVKVIRCQLRLMGLWMKMLASKLTYLASLTQLDKGQIQKVSGYLYLMIVKERVKELRKQVLETSTKKLMLAQH